MKNVCPTCRNVNELSMAMCRFCGTPLTPPQPATSRVARPRRWPAVVIGLAVLLILPVGGYIVTSGNNSTPSADANAYEIGTDEGAALKFNPEIVNVPADTPIKITFINQAQLAHNLAFGAPINQKTAEQVVAGGTEELSFTSPGPGEYEYDCTIHPGMKGKMVVEAKK